MKRSRSNSSKLYRVLGTWAAVVAARLGGRRLLCVFAVVLVTSAALVVVENDPSEAAIECIGVDADPDGDGYGFENGETCAFAEGKQLRQPKELTTFSGSSDDDNQSLDGSRETQDAGSEQVVGQGILFRQRAWVVLGEGTFNRFESLIDAVEIVIDKAIAVSGNRGGFAGELGRVSVELAGLTVCPAQSVAVSELVADKIVQGYESGSSSFGNDVADQLSGLVGSLDGEGRITVEQDQCIPEKSIVEASEQLPQSNGDGSSDQNTPVPTAPAADDSDGDARPAKALADGVDPDSTNEPITDAAADDAAVVESTVVGSTVVESTVAESTAGHGVLFRQRAWVVLGEGTFAQFEDLIDAVEVAVDQAVAVDGNRDGFAGEIARVSVEFSASTVCPAQSVAVSELVADAIVRG